ncbi:MAG TPA: sigma-70 family RNA polymerase sigma factor [Gemmataceae bacterium]|jgi:RNA polymerase sigma factor (sigma-70 family)|nr:sigma-70 family RNA polymerase sigma factor [Gemmataceae bacterium]
MAAGEEDWQRLIQGLRDGDRHIVQEFCVEFGAALERLAEKHLPPRLRRRVGPEDIVQSACRTFLRRVKGGEFQLADSESLWRLLCAITLTKVREQMRFHLRQNRGVDRETDLGSEDSSAPGFQPRARGPSPAEAAQFADQFRQLMSSLDEEERQLVDWKLQECTDKEVAERLGCSERTVRRIFKRVKARLTRAFEVP